jgi:hypothetical protein
MATTPAPPVLLVQSTNPISESDAATPQGGAFFPMSTSYIVNAIVVVVVVANETRAKPGKPVMEIKMAKDK